MALIIHKSPFIFLLLHHQLVSSVCRLRPVPAHMPHKIKRRASVLSEVTQVHLQISYQVSSVQFIYSVVSDYLKPHGLQHSRPPCSSPTPGAYSNSCPLSWWCHPTISSSVVPFSSCLQSFLASGSFQMSQFFASGGQSIGVSASTSVLPMNTQDWFPLRWTGWISLHSRDSQKSSPTLQFKRINSSAFSFLYSPTLTSRHDYWKNHSIGQTDFCWQSNVSAFW